MIDDRELVNRTRDGDRKAFAMLVDRYQSPIYNLAARMVRDPDDAADITQNAFVKAFRNLDRYNHDHKFFSWLYRIAVNESLNHLERCKRAREFSYELPTSPPRPDEACQEHEDGDHLAQALAAMTLDQRLVIILKHLLMLSYREIARILEIPDKTVKSRLYSARQVLREQLVRQGYRR
jgi:RNA polymerase sigma-70 factor (ECF subfamily)